MTEKQYHILVHRDTKLKLKSLCGLYGYTYDKLLSIWIERTEEEKEKNKSKEIVYKWNQRL